MKRNKFLGFTLAEVLITLSILGIVAAISIPNLVQRYQEKVIITSVKRAYSILDNALQQAIAVDGNPRTWDWPSADTYDYTGARANYLIGEKLRPYLNIKKFCGSATGCMGDTSKTNTNHYNSFNNTEGEAYWAGKDYKVHGKAILSNGMVVSLNSNIQLLENNSPIIGYIFVDINGEKGPNKYGVDSFLFPFNEYGVQLKVSNNYGKVSYCDYNNKTNASNGRSCLIWIMHKNNMDYLHRDVSSEWNFSN